MLNCRMDTRKEWENRKMSYTPENIDSFYNNMIFRSDLSFKNLSIAQRNEISHCYHHYPAKFIPQLIRCLLEEFTGGDDYVWDPFCGSGTLNVEAFRNERNSLGSDINPVALLISRAKTTPLPPKKLTKYKNKLYELIRKSEIKNIKYYLRYGVLNGNCEELQKWFPESNLLELSNLLYIIKNNTSERKYRDFALCCFSSILKKTSYWLNTSIKSQIDPNKIPTSPIENFIKQFDRMERANEKFYEETNELDTRVILIKHDAKYNLPRSYRRKFDAVMTSPPYLVSYEYSDIFRLSSYFLYYQENYGQLNTNFIGTKRRKNIHRRLIEKFFTSDDYYRGLYQRLTENRLYIPISNYYEEMRRFIYNANKNLKNHGKLILIVGDTKMRSISIPNAFILSKIADSYGFTLTETYKRKISGKNLPTYRNKKTGRFTSKNDPGKIKIHAEEYILVFEKG